MKKLLATALLGAAVAATSYGQGTVSFKNYFGHPTTDPAVFFSNGTTRVTGSQYIVALMAGPSAGSLAQVATTPFLSAAAAAGFFQAGTVAIPTVAGGGTAFIQIDVWDTTLNGTTTGATFAQAAAYSLSAGVGNEWGSSAVFSLTTGNPSGTPPTTPTFLVPGLTSFNLNTVPEPTSLALLGLGSAGLMFFRRRK
ncbi:MAG TPA: PEP-CTERM sorting domain-containing protein [Verrucomicrobiae bacterium]|nr:PEP-CTERM sorting domain-containing protein [Verrucomicrobiae bacterium]